jgi:hypothetical protein
MRKKFLKLIYFFILLPNVFYSTLGLTMQKENLSDDIIINQLKAQGIQPHITYIHSDYNYSKYKNFPTQPFITLAEAEKINPNSSDNIIQFIELDDNYQYKSILEKDRDLIDILFPIAMFDNYPDGEHFFTLDEKYQLHHLNSVEDALAQDCYLKIIIQQGKVVKMQKRPLAFINKTIFTYWPNGNIQTDISEKLDLNNNALVRYEIENDQTGKRIKMLEHNLVTNYTAVMTYLYTNDVYSIMDIFNEKGVKVNRTITHDKTGNVESQYLDESGNIVKTTNSKPEIFYDQDLPQPAIYQSIPMDFKRAHHFHISNFIQQMAFNKDTTIADQEAITRAKFLGIKPNSSYYHPTPFPKWAEERYKNYPHQFAMSLSEAEFQYPKEEYVDLVKVTVGDNYQYQTISMEKWQQVPLSLPLEQFKSLENGSYFFSLDDKGQLIPLDGIEQAISLPRYVRVEKVMGKIDSILQKTRIQKTLQQYEYKDNNQMIKQILKVLESPVMPSITIETIYDDIGLYTVSQTIKDNENRKIAVFSKVQKDRIYGVIERFTPDGVKTNHIIRYYGYYSDGVENQYLDEEGNIKFTTSHIKNKNNPQLYDMLPVYSDEFIGLMFNKFLDNK